MVAAFLNFDDAVNYVIAAQEKADAECKKGRLHQQG
jgi:hypothetical protein